jgi:hypothetical protein
MIAQRTCSQADWSKNWYGKKEAAYHGCATPDLYERQECRRAITLAVFIGGERRLLHMEELPRIPGDHAA